MRYLLPVSLVCVVASQFPRVLASRSRAKIVSDGNATSTTTTSTTGCLVFF